MSYSSSNNEHIFFVISYSESIQNIFCGVLSLCCVHTSRTSADAYVNWGVTKEIGLKPEEYLCSLFCSSVCCKACQNNWSWWFIIVGGKKLYGVMSFKVILCENIREDLSICRFSCLAFRLARLRCFFLWSLSSSVFLFWISIRKDEMIWYSTFQSIFLFIFILISKKWKGISML